MSEQQGCIWKQRLPLNLAVVQRAVWDWKQLCAKGAKNADSRAVGEAMREMRALRRFFNSRLCAFYLNGLVSQRKLVTAMEEIYSGSLLSQQVDELNRKM